MPQIDLKNVTVRLTDGRRATFSPASVPANSRLTFTDVDYHRGTRATVDPISVTIVKAGSSTALSVTVSGKDITINVATDGGGVNTSTANQIITAYNLVAPAKALASIANFAGSSGAGLTDAVAKTSLTNGPRVCVVKLGSGNLNWDEETPIVYLDDRGKLDEVKKGDEVPLSVRLAYRWRFLQAPVSSGTPTEEDVFFFRGEAATWVSTSPDQCEFPCIDLELENDVTCGAVTKKEFLMFPMLRAEEFMHDPKPSLVTVQGKCNVVAPSPFEFVA